MFNLSDQNRHRLTSLGMMLAAVLLILDVGLFLRKAESKSGTGSRMEPSERVRKIVEKREVEAKKVQEAARKLSSRVSPTLDLENDVDLVAYSRDIMRFDVEAAHGAALDALGLSSELKERVLQLLTEREAALGDVSSLLTKQGFSMTSAKDRLPMANATKEQLGRYFKELEELVGPETARRIAGVMDREPLRDRIETWAKRIDYGAAPLTTRQRQQLEELIASRLGVPLRMSISRELPADLLTQMQAVLTEEQYSCLLGVEQQRLRYQQARREVPTPKR